MSYKITIKKNFLKENCGDSAAPTVQDVPVQGLPLAGDVSTMTPEAAYDAGRTDAINEIMAVIEGMVSGGIPVDMAIPADIMQMDQLEEEDGECPESGCVHKDDSVDGKWEIESNKTGKDWPAKYKSKKSAENALKAYHANK